MMRLFQSILYSMVFICYSASAHEQEWGSSCKAQDTPFFVYNASNRPIRVKLDPNYDDMALYRISGKRWMQSTIEPGQKIGLRSNHETLGLLLEGEDIRHPIGVGLYPKNPLHWSAQLDDPIQITPISQSGCIMGFQVVYPK